MGLHNFPGRKRKINLSLKIDFGGGGVRKSFTFTEKKFDFLYGLGPQSFSIFFTILPAALLIPEKD